MCLSLWKAASASGVQQKEVEVRAVSGAAR